MTVAEEAQRFLTAYDALKAATGDDPGQLEMRWRDDKNLQALCDELDAAVRVFRIVEDWSELAFTPQVHPSSIAARRDYEARWQRIVDQVSSRDILFLLMDLMAKSQALRGEESGGNEESDTAEIQDELGDKIAMWREEAVEEARSIDQMVEHAFQEREDDPFFNFEWVDASLRAWDRLTKVVKLDIAGALWRRRAVPHILIPTHVSQHYGDARLSLYRRLHQAERACERAAP